MDPGKTQKKGSISLSFQKEFKITPEQEGDKM